MAQRTALVSVGVRTSLVVLKYVLAVLSGSMALMADAVHNVSDIAQALALYMGVRIADRRTETFPYGLYKLENLISLGVAVLITIVGYELARKAILGGPAEEIENLPWTMGAMALAMAGSYAFSRWEGAIAKRTSSPALEADSRDALIDTLATLAVLLSLVAAWLGYNIDLWATLVIVLFIIYTSAELGVGAIRVLLDASIDHDLLMKVQRTLEADRDVVEVHELKGRNSGPYRFIEGHVVLDVDDLEEAHQISYRLERAVRDVAENIDRVLIHFEPQHKETLLYAAPMATDDLIADDFGQAEKFALVTVGTDDQRVRDVRHIANPYIEAGSGRGILIAHMLRDEDVDAVFIREELEGKGPYYALAAEHVRTVQTEATTLAEALSQENIELEVPADAGTGS